MNTLTATSSTFAFRNLWSQPMEDFKTGRAYWLWSSLRQPFDFPKQNYMEPAEGREKRRKLLAKIQRIFFEADSKKAPQARRRDGGGTNLLAQPHRGVLAVGRVNILAPNSTRHDCDDPGSPLPSRFLRHPLSPPATPQTEHHRSAIFHSLSLPGGPMTKKSRAAATKEKHRSMSHLLITSELESLALSSSPPAPHIFILCSDLLLVAVETPADEEADLEAPSSKPSSKKPHQRQREKEKKKERHRARKKPLQGEEETDHPQGDQEEAPIFVSAVDHADFETNMASIRLSSLKLVDMLPYERLHLFDLPNRPPDLMEGIQLVCLDSDLSDIGSWTLCTGSAQSKNTFWRSIIQYQLSLIPLTPHQNDIELLGDTPVMVKETTTEEWTGFVATLYQEHVDLYSPPKKPGDEPVFVLSLDDCHVVDVDPSKRIFSLQRSDFTYLTFHFPVGEHFRAWLMSLGEI